jgi:hypothetical protein
MAKEVSKEVLELFKRTLDNLDSEMFPFYKRFLAEPNKRNSGNVLFDNIIAFSPELGLRLSEVDVLELNKMAFLEFIFSKRVKLKSKLSDEKKRKQLEDWGFNFSDHPDLGKVLMDDWDSTVKLARACSKDMAKDLFGWRLHYFDKLILEFGLTGLVTLAQRCDRDDIDYLLGWGFNCCGNILKPYEENGIVEFYGAFLSVGRDLIELSKSCPKKSRRAWFMYGLAGWEDLINSRDDLFKIGRTLSALAKECPEENVEALFNHGLSSCKRFIKDEDDMYEVGLVLIELSRYCPADRLDAVFDGGLSKFEELVKTKEDILVVGRYFIELAKACPANRARGLFNYELSEFKEFILRFGLEDFVALAKDCPKDSFHSIVEYGLKTFKGSIDTREDLLYFGNGLILLAKACPKDGLEDIFLNGVPSCKDIFIRFGFVDIVSLVKECQKKKVYVFITCGLPRCAYLINTREDLLEVGKVLIGLARSCPEDYVLEVFYYGLFACKDIIKTADDLSDVGAGLIKLSGYFSGKDAVYRLFTEGLPQCKDMVISEGIDVFVTVASVCSKKCIDELFRTALPWCRDIILMVRLSSFVSIVKESREYSAALLKHVVYLFRDDILSGRVAWADVEDFTLNFFRLTRHISSISFIPKDDLKGYVKRLDYQGLSSRCDGLVDDIRYSTCDGLAQMGFLSCHVTNAFGGGAALVEGEERREDAFKNIMTCIENQGTNKFQLSFSTLSHKTSSGLATTFRYGISGGVGVILDSGYIYESYTSDANTATKKSASSEASFRTGVKSRRVESGLVVNYASNSYNELLVRRWTVGGLFYTKGVQEEHIERLKKLSEEYSFRMYPNPEYLSRKVAFGVAKEIEKVFPVYEVDPQARTWKMVYTPVKKDTVEEFRELIETATADTCRKLSKKGGISKFIPEWDRFTSDESGWQHAFHDFRLDEHTIRLFEYFDSSYEFKKLEDRYQRILRITALLHDITKEGGSVHFRPAPDPEHPERSAELVMDILKRLNYDAAMIKTVYKLVYFHDALGNIAVYGDIADKVKPGTYFKVKYTLRDLAKFFFKDEIPLLKVFTKADIYAIKNDGVLLKGESKFWSILKGSSMSLERAIDMCASEISKINP